MDSPEEILSSWFMDGLNDNLYEAYVDCGDLVLLHDWYILAEEAEIDQARNQYRVSYTWMRSPSENGDDRTTWFNCGKDRHCMADCHAKIPA